LIQRRKKEREDQISETLSKLISIFWCFAGIKRKDKKKKKKKKKIEQKMVDETDEANASVKRKRPRLGSRSASDKKNYVLSSSPKSSLSTEKQASMPNEMDLFASSSMGSSSPSSIPTSSPASLAQPPTPSNPLTPPGSPFNPEEKAIEEDLQDPWEMAAMTSSQSPVPYSPPPLDNKGEAPNAGEDIVQPVEREKEKEKEVSLEPEERIPSLLSPSLRILRDSILREIRRPGTGFLFFSCLLACLLACLLVLL